MPHAFPLGQTHAVSESDRMNLIDMNDERRKRQGKTEEEGGGRYDGKVCGCGQAWFLFRAGLGMVTVAEDGHLTGYYGKLVCSSCGTGI